MQRRLDLNELSGKVLVTAGVFLFAIPWALFAVLLLLEYNRVAAPAIPMLIELSLSLGVLVAVAFGILVVVEQIQDRWFHQNYRRQTDRKIECGDGRYECQYCGNREVNVSDQFCRVCGKTLR